MRVKFLQSIAGSGSPDGIQFPNFSFPEGFVGNIPNDTLAQAWIDSGICVEAEHHELPRPPKPEFAVAITPEAAMARKGPGRPKKSVDVKESFESTEELTS